MKKKIIERMQNRIMEHQKENGFEAIFDFLNEDIEELSVLSSTPSKPSDDIQVIEYEGFLYWYQHKLAKDRVDICLGTKDPKKYCNGFYLYSTKDPGSGKEFVVIGTNNPDFYKEWMRNNNPVEQPQQIDWDKVEKDFHYYMVNNFRIGLSAKDFDLTIKFFKSQQHRFCSNCGADWKVNPNTEQKKPILICGCCKKEFDFLISDCDNCGNKL